MVPAGLELAGVKDAAGRQRPPRPRVHPVPLGDRPVGGVVVRRADAEGLPCYLETFQPRNVPLYLKHGFQIMAEEVEPASCLRAWFFLRRPR